MKKRGIVLAFFTAILLTGCMNPSYVHVVEDMYRAAVSEDWERAASYFSKEFFAEREPMEQFLEEIAWVVREMEGADMMNSRELKRKQISNKLTEELDEQYGENWRLVVSQSVDDTVMLWVVQKGADQYYIADGKQISAKVYREEVLIGKKLH